MTKRRLAGTFDEAKVLALAIAAELKRNKPPE